MLDIWNGNAEWRSCALILALLPKIRYKDSIVCLQYNFQCGCDTLTQVFQYFTLRSMIWTWHYAKKKSPIQIMPIRKG